LHELDGVRHGREHHGRHAGADAPGPRLGYLAELRGERVERGSAFIGIARRVAAAVGVLDRKGHPDTGQIARPAVWDAASFSGGVQAAAMTSASGAAARISDHAEGVFIGGAE
jgi:hypothetical protein